MAAATMAAMTADFLRSFRSRRVGWVLAASAVVGVLIGLQTLVLHLQLDPLADVHAYYDAGARLNAGLPLYDQPAGTDDADFYRYPPLLAVAFRPLALLSFETAAAIWEAFLLALFAATIVRMGASSRWTWLVLCWLAAPIAWSLAIGQAQVAVTFLLAIGSPLGVATAAHLKLLPALVAVFWIGRRDWASLLRFVAWTAGLGLLSLLMEPRGTIAFLGFTDLAQVGDVQNLSPYATSPILWVASTAILLALALRFAPTRAGWALAICLAVFASPRLLMYQVSTLQAAVRQRGGA
jgi:glycosyl transferase family 87